MYKCECVSSFLLFYKVSPQISTWIPNSADCPENSLQARPNFLSIRPMTLWKTTEEFLWCRREYFPPIIVFPKTSNFNFSISQVTTRKLGLFWKLLWWGSVRGCCQNEGVAVDFGQLQFFSAIENWICGIFRRWIHEIGRSGCKFSSGYKFRQNSRVFGCNFVWRLGRIVEK